MRTIHFSHPDDADAFSNLYAAFIRSGKAPANLEEIDLGLGVLRKLQALSCEEQVEGGTVRRLTGDGALILEEREYDYLKTAVYPPQARWSHGGLLTFIAIRDKFEAATKEEAGRQHASQNGAAVAGAVA